MSMDKLVPVKDESPDGTGYNDPPVNLKEITEEQFAQSGFDGTHIEYVEFRQMILHDDLSAGKLSHGKLVQARLFWFGDDTGVAISNDYWKGKVRFFSFGCNHTLTDPARNDSALDKPFKPIAYEASKTYRCTKCKTDVHEPWMDLIVSDSGWHMNSVTSIPIRGIRDYERTIRFKSPLGDKEISKVTRFLRKTDCPGWTGVGVRDLGSEHAGLLFKFNTTHDSSD